MFYVIPYFDLYFINILGFKFRSWEITLWIGVFFCFLVLSREFLRFKLNKKTVFLIFVLQLFLQNFFERVLFFLSRYFLHKDAENFSFENYTRLGRIYFGTLIGLALAIFVGSLTTKQLKKIPSYFDLFFLAHLPSIFFYRIGNIFYHSHIGKVTTMPWGMEYMGKIRHETSLYEALSVAILFSLVWFFRKKVQKSGIIFLFILAWLSLSRVITDFFRNDDLQNSNFHLGSDLTLNQLAYGLVFLICSGLIIYIYKVKKIDIFKTVKEENTCQN